MRFKAIENSIYFSQILFNIIKLIIVFIVCNSCQHQNNQNSFSINPQNDSLVQSEEFETSNFQPQRIVSSQSESIINQCEQNEDFVQLQENFKNSLLNQDFKNSLDKFLNIRQYLSLFSPNEKKLIVKVFVDRKDNYETVSFLKILDLNVGKTKTLQFQLKNNKNSKDEFSENLTFWLDDVNILFISQPNKRNSDSRPQLININTRTSEGFVISCFKQGEFIVDMQVLNRKVYLLTEKNFIEIDLQSNQVSKYYKIPNAEQFPFINGFNTMHVFPEIHKIIISFEEKPKTLIKSNSLNTINRHFIYDYSNNSISKLNLRIRTYPLYHTYIKPLSGNYIAIMPDYSFPRNFYQIFNMESEKVIFETYGRDLKWLNDDIIIVDSVQDKDNYLYAINVKNSQILESKKIAKDESLFAVVEGKAILLKNWNGPDNMSFYTIDLLNPNNPKNAILSGEIPTYQERGSVFVNPKAIKGYSSKGSPLISVTTPSGSSKYFYWNKSESKMKFAFESKN